MCVLRNKNVPTGAKCAPASGNKMMFPEKENIIKVLLITIIIARETDRSQKYLFSEPFFAYFYFDLSAYIPRPLYTYII